MPCDQQIEDLMMIPGNVKGGGQGGWDEGKELEQGRLSEMIDIF